MREETFSGIRPGDRVTVTWPKRRRVPWEGPSSDGVVVQVTPRLVILRAPAGYCFSVSRADLATGTCLKVVGAG